MAEKRRIPFLLGGLLLMFVALQFLTVGIRGLEGDEKYRYIALLFSFVAEYLLSRVYKESTAPVKFVILLVSLVPVICIAAVIMIFVSVPLTALPQ